ncbi:MAG: peptidylprolyl isomerase [Gammaproteobacteria bacterium]|nr:peptidylprolyl isomerase [Gammaproteobacteria bacterium]MDH5777172.1 peptidylprolyl isomerase [Gammaproteobacteria bacterium]
MRQFALGLFLITASFNLWAAGAAVQVHMETNKGRIVLEVYPDKAPKTVANFLQYIDEAFYSNTIFHRVINGFMIQGGGFDTNYHRKSTRPAIINEADNGLKNERGSIAMARTLDPHSATSQFFINVVDNDFLDHKGKNPRGWGYAVFGKVVEGMEIVDMIKAIPTIAAGPFPKDVPRDPVIIIKISRAGAQAISPAKPAN